MNRLFVLLCIILTTTTIFSDDIMSHFTREQASTKSARNAMIMSAILPGTGQLYVGNETKAGIFFTADILAIGTYARLQKEKRITTDNYTMFAHINAGLRRDASSEILGLAARYRSAQSYNDEVVQFARNRFLIWDYDPVRYEAYIQRWSIPPEDFWLWENDADFWEYRSIRNDRQNYELMTNFALGAILLNRILSSLDAAISTNKFNKNTRIYSIPDFQRNGVSLIYEYKF
jgi:hypothetical protein